MEAKIDVRDVFISYSTEDKNAIARPIANALIEQDLSVWFDEFELKIGDSIRESIDKGLSQSSYGVVILSPTYFERHWTTAELNALAARESKGKKVILPVWHNIDRDFVLEKSPLLADRFAGRSAEGIENVVRMIIARIRKDTSNTVTAEMEILLNSIENKELAELKATISVEPFPKLRREYKNLLYAINFFEIAPAESNINIFKFLKEAILNRPENEAKELFETLIDWYIESTTPLCNEFLLNTFLGLIKLPFAKEVVKEKKHSRLFVVEFGKSGNWDTATLTTEILVNIMTLLSQSDKRKIVEYLIDNSQISGSFAAKGYLYKFLDYFEGDVAPDRIEAARKALG